MQSEKRRRTACSADGVLTRECGNWVIGLLVECIQAGAKFCDLLCGGFEYWTEPLKEWPLSRETECTELNCIPKQLFFFEGAYPINWASTSMEQPGKVAWSVDLFVDGSTRPAEREGQADVQAARPARRLGRTFGATWAGPPQANCSPYLCNGPH